MEFVKDIFGSKKIAAAVIVAALGYFVDAYDIVVFSVVRVQSLKSLGLSDEEVTSAGSFLLNMQMLGMLLGGIAWGIWGDKKGRVKVLLGSILVYSLANLANAFVTNVEQYAICRLIAGFGLAGEIGAGITLVSELMPKKNRGYATTLVAAFGVTGPIVAGLLAPHLSWNALYILGGVMGLLLLLMRVMVSESDLFKNVSDSDIAPKGNLILLFSSRYRVIRIITCVFLGVPIWLCAGLFLMFCPEIGKALNIETPLLISTAVTYFSISYALGDLVAGFSSQFFKSRLKILFFFIFMAMLCVTYILSGHVNTATEYYCLITVAVFFVGYWSVLLTTTAEQFGTNLRATVTTSVPNFIRASTIILTTSLLFLKPYVGMINGLIIISAIVFVLSFMALLYLRETYGKDLDYQEEKRL